MFYLEIRQGFAYFFYLLTVIVKILGLLRIMLDLMSFQIYFRFIVLLICMTWTGNSRAGIIVGHTQSGENMTSGMEFPVNSAPVTQDDTISVIKKTPTNIYVLENDYDPDGSGQIDPGSIVIVKNPGHGTVTIDYVNGIISYESAVNYQGLDDFEYVVSDYNSNVSNSSKVQITVMNNPNWLPSALCKDGVAYLDENGLAEFSPQDIDDGSTSNYPQSVIVKWLVDRQELPVLTCSQLGATEVTLTVTDDMYLSSTCSATIMVYDTIAPAVDYAVEDVYGCADRGSEAIVPYDVPLFRDNCDGEGLEGVLIEGKSSGSLFPIGTTLVTYSYTDSEGNGPVTYSFNVHVLTKPQTGSIFQGAPLSARFFQVCHSK